MTDSKPSGDLIHEFQEGANQRFLEDLRKFDREIEQFCAEDVTPTALSLDGLASEFFGARAGVQGVCFSGRSPAIRAALWAAGVQLGSEVIIPSFGSTHLMASVIESNATPVFADVGLESWNLEPDSLEGLITDKTKAILVAHIAGCPADMDAISTIADAHGVPIIEDVGTGFGGRYRGKPLGSMGAISVFSIQPSLGLPGAELGFAVTEDEQIYGKIPKLGSLDRGYESARMNWGALLARAMIKRRQETAKDRLSRGEELARRIGLIPGVDPQAIQAGRMVHAYENFAFRFAESRWNGVTREQILNELVAQGIPVKPAVSCALFDSTLVRSLDFGPYQGCTLSEKDLDAAAERCPHSRQLAEREAAYFEGDFLLGTQSQLDAVIRAMEAISSRRHDWEADWE